MRDARDARGMTSPEKCEDHAAGLSDEETPVGGAELEGGRSEDVISLRINGSSRHSLRPVPSFFRAPEKLSDSWYGSVRRRSRVARVDLGLCAVMDPRSPPSRTSSQPRSTAGYAREVRGVLNALKAAFAMPSYAPCVEASMLSDMFLLARTPDLELREYRSVLERDPLVAARLIRTAQSAGYGTVVRPVATLDEAFARLGVLQLRRFCSDGAAQLQVLNEPLYARAYEQIARHGVATAHVARMLGARLGIDGELAFLAGLLHDVGLAAAFVEVAQGEAKLPTANVEAAWEISREASSQASIALTRAWSLSPELGAITVGHHDPPPHVDRLTAVVAFANWAASEAGYGLPDEGDAPSSSVLGALSLSDEDVSRLADEAAKVLVHVDVE